MLVAVFDGTFRGFLTAVHTLLEQGISCVHIEANGESSLFDEDKQEIVTDSKIYEIMIDRILKRLLQSTLYIIKSAFLSETHNIEDALFTFIREGLTIGTKIIHYIADAQINQVLKASKKTANEVHRYMGILRFSAQAGEIKYAQIAPDTHVIPMLASHFKKRFPNEPWIIHDTNRALILFHEPGSLRLIDGEALLGQPQQPTNTDPYKALWIKYFNSMTIDSRKNSDLQRQFIPLKRRKYMIELNL